MAASWYCSLVAEQQFTVLAQGSPLRVLLQLKAEVMSSGTTSTPVPNPSPTTGADSPNTSSQSTAKPTAADASTSTSTISTSTSTSTTKAKQPGPPSVNYACSVAEPTGYMTVKDTMQLLMGFACSRRLPGHLRPIVGR